MLLALRRIPREVDPNNFAFTAGLSYRVAADVVFRRLGHSFVPGLLHLYVNGFVLRINLWAGERVQFLLFPGRIALAYVDGQGMFFNGARAKKGQTRTQGIL